MSAASASIATIKAWAIITGRNLRAASVDGDDPVSGVTPFKLPAFPVCDKAKYSYWHPHQPHQEPASKPVQSKTALARAPFGKPFVAAPGFKTNVVNRSMPDLFPAACILKKSFIPPKTRSIAPLAWTRARSSNLLKTTSILSLTNCPLNGI